MTTTRKTYSAKFKARVATEALRGEKTLSQLGSQYKVHPIQIAKWRKLVLDQMPELFVDGRRKAPNSEVESTALFEEIGRLKVELDWLKKKLACSSERLRPLVDRDYCKISVRRQCELLGLNRSNVYYEPTGESQEKLRLMRWIDEHYTATPFFGSRRMAAWLREHRKVAVNRKRIARLMQKMGLEAVYPKPKLSQPGEGHKVYPYLLKGLQIERVNQVWSTDITYIRLAQGFCYLVAVMDWHSRFVLSWSLSVTMEMEFCLEALAVALRPARPEIFNSDQGSQFTSERFTGELQKRGISISMDGRGRCFDNIFIERLWRSLKHEEVYLKDYTTVEEAKQGIKNYFQFYNHERQHQSLDYRTPAAIYRKGETESPGMTTSSSLRFRRVIVGKARAMSRVRFAAYASPRKNRAPLTSTPAFPKTPPAMKAKGRSSE